MPVVDATKNFLLNRDRAQVTINPSTTSRENRTVNFILPEGITASINPILILIVHKPDAIASDSVSPNQVS